jgi:hypothetical protein
VSLVGVERVLATAILLLANAALAIPAEDLAGWTKAKWGMNLEQVAAEFPAAVADTDPRRPKSLVQSGFQIGTIAYRIRFVFGVSGLEEVVLDPEGDKRYLPKISTDNLLKLLTDKYGAPDIIPAKRERYMTSYEWRWLFPSTTIRLRFSDFGSGYNSVSAVTYSRRVISDVL